MKVIIMETKGKEAIALNQNGRFVKIHNLGYRVGQELQIPAEMIIRSNPQKSPRTMQKLAVLAACFCLLLGAVLSFVVLNSQSYGYVSVDVNPSIEYRLNRFDRVVSVSAVNQDGEALISSIGVQNLEGADIELALSRTVQELSVQGYLSSEQAEILISSSAGSKKASEALNQKLISYMQSEDVLKNVEVITTVVTREIIEEASKLGTTAGKLQLIKELGDDVSIEEWIDKSVVDIHEAIKEQSSEIPTTPIDTEAEVETPPEVTVEPDTSVDTEEETATSESVPDETDEPNAPTETVESVTETEAETATEIPTEAPTETALPTEPETKEELTWPETFPNQMPSEWPEEWPEPETDENGNAILPEPEKKPWWWWLWELIFGWH
ncbi:MAG: hypothetical protein E7645_00510 [Ruminococcaceae bacterium]|nr:hypothetical protein [Oscillospiraceae bacterium]